ncbi:O-antigen ligase family protein (plasmid) [Photobacterium sp. DA100]|uniref:O-antigen ligase family protein n=1 Tax=Photobacterium sp. DA100 TaxID=3027472 RepID=UPI00247A4F04|nr:O-antigen ligase family protein [Photobacterium sp. DA100]WEM45616.1 O-antigen ligase family protein [Photobacterium sp. DA100]
MSTFNSDDVVFSARYFLYYLGLFFLCCALYNTVTNQVSQMYRFFAVISILLFLSVGMAFWLRIYFELEVNIHTIFSFSNPRFLNQIQVWLVIPLLYMSILNIKRNKNIIILNFALMLSVAVIIATDARGISIALFSVVILWSLIDGAWRREILTLSFKVAILGYIIKLIILSPVPGFIFGDGILDFGTIRTDSPGRLQLWKDSLSLIDFLGGGGGYFVCTSEYNDSPKFGHPHNSMLQALIEWGALAAISYCLLLASLFYKVITTNRRIVRVSGLSLLAGFAYSFVSGVLVMPLSQLLAVLSIAIFWHRLKGKSPSQKGKYTNSFSSLLLIAASLIVFSLIDMGGERIEMYQSGFLQNEQIENERVRIDFWLGHNCS